MRARLFAFSCSLLIAGCASPPISPASSLSVEQKAAAFSARSLRDPALRRFVTGNLGRDPGDAWDFEALAWAAFYFHPSLELARAQWATSRAVEQSAGLRPNPTITLTPGYNFTREAGLSPWMPAINLDFLFSTSTQRDLQKAIARSDAEAARLAVVGVAWQVRSELRRSLADLSVARRRGEALTAQAVIQRRVVQLLVERQAAGSIGISEVSVARTALLRAESAAVDASGQAIVARARVAAAIGLPASALESVTLASPPSANALAVEALAAARTAALHARADILAALAKYQSAHSSLELEVAKRVPGFHLGPGYQWDQGANKWTVALAFELPLFHRNEAPVAEATARRAEAAAQFGVVQAQVVAAIDSAVAAQQAAQLQVENARRMHAEAQQQSGRMQQRFELGGADQVALQTARLDLAAADTATLEAENAAVAVAGQLEDALQIPFPNLAVLTTPPAVHE